MLYDKDVPTLTDLMPTLVGIALLITIGALVLAWARVGKWWSPALAVLRGALQLAVLSVVLTGVITSPYWVTAALLVMFCVAAVTSVQRIGWSIRKLSIVALAMFAGVGVSLLIIFATGAIEFAPRYLLALGGILIGGAMTVATLTVRHVQQLTTERWSEVEGWFALGATPRQATSAFAIQSVREALVPSTDQTKTTGLVTLPGAFIGAIFGGLDPLEAGRFQIVVLAAILAAGAITAVMVARGLAPVRQKPDVRLNG